LRLGVWGLEFGFMYRVEWLGLGSRFRVWGLPATANSPSRGHPICERRRASFNASFNQTY
jgi:hypothetical protein